VVEIRFAGTRDCYVFPSTEYSHFEDDEETGERRRITYAERWPRQYQQFKAKTAQTKEGTPLDYLPFLTEGKRAELRALSIYTAEALAEQDGQPLKNLGMGGRDLKKSCYRLSRVERSQRRGHAHAATDRGALRKTQRSAGGNANIWLPRPSRSRKSRCRRMTTTTRGRRR
jgi:hypothetical protein